MAEYVAALYVGLADRRPCPLHNARPIMSDTQLTSRNLRTPKAAAIAGIIFSVLLIATFWLLHTSFPPQAAVPGVLLNERLDAITTALSLIPFAGSHSSGSSASCAIASASARIAFLPPYILEAASCFLRWCLPPEP